MTRRLAATAILCGLAGATPAQEVSLALPAGAVETARLVEDPGAARFPTDRFTPTEKPALAREGRVLLRAWRLPSERADTLAVMRALRPQLAEAGFEILFDCMTAACGGFDFRFGTRVLPAPAMEFDLTDFRALTARREGDDEGGPVHLSLIVSRSPRGGFVQAIELREDGAADPGPLEVPAPLESPPEAVPDGAASAEPEAVTPEAGDIAAALARDGRAVLGGVVFDAGARALDAKGSAALAPLAELMRARPDLAIVLVGHTDAEGSLEANIAVSRQRAAAVRAALVRDYGIAAARIGAEGAGFLAPRAPNDTPEGRALNRRVEVILR